MVFNVRRGQAEGHACHMAVRTFNGNLYFLFSATGLDWMRDGDHVLPRGVPRHVQVMRVLSASVNGGAYLPRFDQDHSRE